MTNTNSQKPSKDYADKGSKEYIKKETGEKSVPMNPQQNPGNHSHTKQDLEQKDEHANKPK